jgi:hypothetical protein
MSGGCYKSTYKARGVVDGVEEEETGDVGGWRLRWNVGV